MTIIEAIKEVLKYEPNGLSSSEIYQKIIDRNLYQFGAKNPVGVVNGEIRRHCLGLDFPTAYPVKHFAIAGKEGKKLKFTIANDNISEKKTTPSKRILDDHSESLPEEKIANAIDEHLQQIKQQLLDNIMSNHPDFFEQLVVELLLKMGYGYDDNSGIVTGGSHDNGIDGIISEDKLGLDLIYIQAKRYLNTNKVGRKELQAFIGAMGHIQKGVFITTSSYTKEAYIFGTQQQQKSIKLIDGSMLADYMVKYGIGVESVKTFNIYKINSDYFKE
jgi:mrr restriction system protein